MFAVFSVRCIQGGSNHWCRVSAFLGVFISRWSDCSGWAILFFSWAFVCNVHMLATTGVVSERTDCSVVGTVVFHGSVSAVCHWFANHGLFKGSTAECAVGNDHGFSWADACCVQ